ncbi:hypothetical protein [Gluconobacter aidae]|uniref:hypothetical protein n=1 Tax=Gluconobacter aidae TaxID=2662454 RepID=UPI002D78F084|nr:hypothetical protein [Gluconobacter aidae]
MFRLDGSGAGKGGTCWVLKTVETLMEFNQLTFQGADMLLGAARARPLLHVTDQTYQESEQKSDNADSQDESADGQMPAEGNQPDGFQICIAQGKNDQDRKKNDKNEQSEHEHGPIVRPAAQQNVRAGRLIPVSSHDVLCEWYHAPVLTLRQMAISPSTYHRKGFTVSEIIPLRLSLQEITAFRTVLQYPDFGKISSASLRKKIRRPFTEPDPIVSVRSVCLKDHRISSRWSKHKHHDRV